MSRTRSGRRRQASRRGAQRWLAPEGARCAGCARARRAPGCGEAIGSRGVEPFVSVKTWWTDRLPSRRAALAETARGRVASRAAARYGRARSGSEWGAVRLRMRRAIARKNRARPTAASISFERMSLRTAHAYRAVVSHRHNTWLDATDLHRAGSAGFDSRVCMRGPRPRRRSRHLPPAAGTARLVFLTSRREGHREVTIG